jgi:hypothetical protein
MKINGRLISFTLILIAVQTLCKIAFADDPDWSGFSPFIAIALFSGFIVKEKNMSFLLPMLALFMSDAIIHLLYLNNKAFPFPGFYPGQWKNYLLLLAVTGIGWLLKGRSYQSLIAAAFAGPAFYFLGSNFMVWRATTEAVYAKSFGGLMTCYEAALPFYRNSLIATVAFLPVFIVCYNLLTKNKAELKLA